MTLNTVTLTWDLADLIQSGVNATITLVPTAVLTDTTDHIVIPQVSRSRVFTGGTGSLPGIIACDNVNITPVGWAYTITITLANGTVLLSQVAFINFASGATQDLSTLVSLTSVTTWVPAVGAPVFGVAPPTGATAADTASIAAAITRMTAAGGNGTLQLQDGKYQVDGNALVIRNCSNFAVKGTGTTVITQAPNRTALPNNTSGDIFVIADSSDFQVDGITFDGLRDTVAPLTPLTVAPSSGASSVTVAAGQGARYIAGEILSINGGLGTGDQNTFQQSLVVQSVAAGGGSGGGDLITFTSTISNTYTFVSATAFTDGFGPYAYAGVYLSPYDTGNATVAGRFLQGENQQSGIHLMSCTRFIVSRCEARNVWNSPFKLGTGYQTSSLTDGCTQGTVTDCIATHGNDQGISVWVSRNITVKGCVSNATGWAAISLTQSDDCVVTGNQAISPLNRTWSDNGGCGIVTEGGVHNQIKGNIINSPWADGIRLTNSPMGWGYTAGTAPTITSYQTAQTGAGTSIPVSATANFQVGAGYSIADGARTEAVTIASVADGTHVTFKSPLKYSHPAGVYIVNRVAQENVIEGNTITGLNPGGGVASNGILASVAVRTVIKDNVIQEWGFGAGGSGSGVNLIYSNGGVGAALPSGVYLGGNGSVIEGNVIGGGAGPAVTADSTDNLSICLNRFWGAVNNNAILVLNGVTDSIIKGNYITDGFKKNGILTQAGTLAAAPCARLVIEGNIVRRTFQEGICLTSGTALQVTGNAVSSCGGNAGIDLRGIQYSVISGNSSSSNQADGILLENNGGTFCLFNSVTGNTTRDDGTGINVQTGATWNQQHGIVESGSSNNNFFLGNESDSNAVDQLTTVGAGTYVAANIISGVLAASPLLPAKNLSDLASASTARTNLGLTGAATAALPLSLANGGTGQASAAAAYNALSPMTTTGDLEYESGSATASRLAGPTSAVKQFLTSTGTGSLAQAPAWGTIAAGDLGALADPWLPADSGWLAWNTDPAPLGSGTGATSGTVVAIRINVRAAISVTNVILFQFANGTGLVSSQNFAGLYNSSGTQIGITADMTASWGGGSTVFRTMALAGGPFAIPAGFYWVLAVSNETAGATPTWGRNQNNNNNSSNPNLSAAQSRWALGSAGQTALPASFTPSTYLTATSTQWFAALS